MGCCVQMTPFNMIAKNSYLFKNNFVTAILVLVLSCFTCSIHAQLYQKPNEKLILSFSSVDNRMMSICADSNLKYIVYRQGTKDHVDYEYPKDTTDSFKKFKWLVSSGSQSFPFDEATAKNSKPSDYYPYKYYKFAFKDGDKIYLIYQYATAQYLYNLGENSLKTLWVSITDINTKKDTGFDAVLSTRKGSLRLLITLPNFPMSDHDFITDKAY